MRRRSTSPCLALVALSVAAASSITTAGSASAQVTLLVRDDQAGFDVAESGLDDGLREALGGSVRRLEPVLEDLALAAGCAADASDDACIARIANAGDAALVVIEHGAHDGTRWQIHLDLRRGSDGERLRVIHLACATADDCGRELVAALARRGPDPEDPAVATTGAAPEAPSPSPVRVSLHDDPRAASPSLARAAPPPRADRLVPEVLFVTSGALGVAAIVAGGVSGQLAHDAWAEGIITQPDRAAHVASLEAGRDLALGVGAGLAIMGACAATAAVVTMLVDDDVFSTRVVAATDGASGMIALGGTF